MTTTTRWDWLTRLGHWLLAGLFLANYFWLEDGEDPHEWAGYALLALIAVRLVRGLTGPDNIRFSRFVPGPAAVSQQLRHFRAHEEQHRHERRHSPLAGLMVVALLSGILITGVSGWLQETDRFWGEDWVQLTHAWAADITLGLAAVHVSAVLLIQWRFRIPLIQRMIRG